MAGSSSLPLAGVEAVVQGLSQFKGDVKSMGSALDALRPKETLLQRAFSSAWEAVKGFGREILNVAEHALGELLSDAIEFVIQKIGELITATIEAGSEFQTLELRLNRLNFNALIESGVKFDTAQKKSIELTKSQLEWLQKLAATTPYDNTDISNVYTLARSYGFADTRARGLTEDIVNFASGMGLGNTEIERIIVNFGQMQQQGKVTQREMNDLARGSFVPVNDILDRMAANLKKNDKQMTAFRKTGDSVGEFMKAFSQVVEERFTGSAEQMAKTFKAAAANAQDVVKSIGCLHVVKPILDAVGARIAAFTSAFTDNPQRWNRMVAAAQRIGKEISKIVNSLFDLLPSSESLADAAVSAVEGMASWLEKHGPGIKSFFHDLGLVVGSVAKKITDTFFPAQGGAENVTSPFENRLQKKGLELPTPAAPADTMPMFQGLLDAARKIADFINNTLIPALDKFSQWTEENKPLIEEFWSAIGSIIGEFISDLTSRPGAPEGGGGILDAIKSFMQYVIDNKEQITKWVEIMWSVFIVFQVVATVISIVVGIVISLVGVVTLLITIFTGLAAALAAPVVQAILATVAVLGILYAAFMLTKDRIKTFVTDVVKGIDQMGRDVSVKFQTMVLKIKAIPWRQIGVDIIRGMINGIKSGIADLIAAAVAAATAAYQAAKDALDSSSPSKLFMELGEYTMQGFAIGIEKAAKQAVGAMQNAMGQITMPAAATASAARSITNSSNTENNLSLTVNTSASSEPIIQDFNMLRSLAGA